MRNVTKKTHRLSRHKRIRALISGTATRPRIAVFKSNQHIYVQAIDDAARKTLASTRDFTKEVQSLGKKEKAVEKRGAKTHLAYAAGMMLAQQLRNLGIASVVFDRGGFTYHGRIAAVADGLRQGGISL